MKTLFKYVLPCMLIACFSCDTGSQKMVKVDQVMKLDIPESQKKVISVMKFDDRSIGTREFGPWKMGIPDMIMESLGALPYYKVISREYIVKQVVKEQEFQLLGMTDPNSAVKLGNLLNAQYIVIGSFQVFRNNLIINAKVLQVKNGEIVHQASDRGDLDNFYTVQNMIAIKLTEGMKLEITESAKQQLVKKYDTKVIKASLANYEGEKKLEEIEVLKKKNKKEEVKKKIAEAKENFKEALKYDSNYEKAKSNLSKIGLGIPMTL